jgi:hypothetical protein
LCRDFDRGGQIWTAVHHADTDAVNRRERRPSQAGLLFETGKDGLERIGVAVGSNGLRVHDFLVFVDEKLRIFSDRFDCDTHKRHPLRSMSLRSVAFNDLDLE